jgi:hypothetical protein
LAILSRQSTFFFVGTLLTSFFSLNKPLLASREDDDIDDVKRRI